MEITISPTIEFETDLPLYSAYSIHTVYQNTYIQNNICTVIFSQNDGIKFEPIRYKLYSKFDPQ